MDSTWTTEPVLKKVAPPCAKGVNDADWVPLERAVEKPASPVPELVAQEQRIKMRNAQDGSCKAKRMFDSKF